MNYAQLTSTIRSYCENDFPQSVGSLTSAEQIATFVRNAEERIYNAVQIPALRRNVTGNCSAGNMYLTCPEDWLATYSIAVIDPTSSEYYYLLNKDVNFIREAFPFPSTTGRPRCYAIFDDDTFILGPTPDTGYAVELHYFYYPESIVTNGTSWLGDNFESVLLYGALLEAATFMKAEADVMSAYSGRYLEALTLLKLLGDGKNRVDAYRSGQVRIPVR